MLTLDATKGASTHIQWERAHFHCDQLETIRLLLISDGNRRIYAACRESRNQTGEPATAKTRSARTPSMKGSFGFIS
jgi:hypothetical protein